MTAKVNKVPMMNVVLPVDQNGSITFIVIENTTRVGRVSCSGVPMPVKYSLSGVDANRFKIDNTGTITFITAPDFEVPTDVGTNNVYNFNVVGTYKSGYIEAAVIVSVTPVAPPNMKWVNSSSGLESVISELESLEITSRKELRDIHRQLLEKLNPLSKVIPNLSVTTWLVLRYLNAYPGSRPTEIAASLELLGPSLSRVLGGHSKIFNFKVSPGDKRDKLYSLSASGKRIVEKGIKLLEG